MMLARREGRRPHAVDSAGFTLIETLVATILLVTGLLSLFGLLDSTVKASTATRQREAATNLARQILEDARGIPYAQLSPGSIVADLQAEPGLASTSVGPSWQLLRGGATYTVTVEECSIDDGKDGWGKHVNAFGEDPFCKDPGEHESKAGEPLDAQPEDLKRITVDVSWTAHGRSPDVHQVQTVTAAGAAPGLNAINLHLELPFVSTKPVIETQPTSGMLTFAVSSPAGTTAMRWSLEGAAQSPPPTREEGTMWTFSWPIPDPGVSDATYTVSVQAIDKTGVLGPPVSIPVTLIRNTPAPVSGLKGGFNTINVAGASETAVELEWHASAERNVVGYRIYRPAGGLACPSSGDLAVLSVATACIDKEPPKPTSSELTYQAVALYRNSAGAVVQGPLASFTIVGGPPAPPSPPTKLELTHNAEGAVELSWAAPASGPPVVFYRIYRGSTNYTSRYDVTAGATTGYTDSDASPEHTYWVTAVDENMTESTFLGPVTG
jgi:type II secretory pathway pseudopilin PulG